jgi:hypothetical protein
MKNLILIISFLCLNTSAFSQDSISVRTEMDTFTKANYEGQFDYVFSRKELRKQLIKLGAMANGSNSHFELAYERKIAQYASVNIVLSNTNYGDKILNYRSNLSNLLKFGVEPRWYYTMKKDIKNGLISDNLNGNYVGLRTNLNYTDNQDGPENRGFNLISELTWGIQRRILRNQYLDINIGTGFIHRFNTPPNAFAFGEPIKQNRWLYNYRFTYGFILDNNLFKKKTTQNCEALRCFEEEKSLWKIGLNKVVAANIAGVSTNLSLANEHKINNSAWSVETKLGVSAFKYKQSGLQSESYRTDIQLMPRFYWDLNKRIAKGESANNLSGKYVGLGLNYSLGSYKTTYFDKTSNSINLQTSSITPVVGFQKRFLNHLYMDANAGYAIFNKQLTPNWYKKNNLMGNFTLGLSF